MRHKQVNATPKTFIVVFAPEDEVMSGLDKFCNETGINAASFSAIGAFSSAVIGYFELRSKDYKSIPVDEQVEVLSLIGDIIPYRGKPKMHAHVVLGKSDGAVCGGHLLSATVKPTLEVVVTELPAYLHREMNEEFGIPLIRL